MNAAQPEAVDVLESRRLDDAFLPVLTRLLPKLGDADFAIVVGGSGSGEAICCNKLHGIRAALCLDLFVTKVARANNNANVLVTGAKVVGAELGEQILETWLATSFRGEEHQRRIDQIAALERGESLL